MLIFASASLPRMRTSAPTRSSPWTRNAVFFFPSFTPAFFAPRANSAGLAGTKSTCAFAPLGKPVKASRFCFPSAIALSISTPTPGRFGTCIEKYTTLRIMGPPFAYVGVLSHDTPMGHRLSKITTRTGDGGDTGLGDGSRVRKDNPRVAALGEIDELNSALGVLLAEALPEKIRASLESIQHDLFDLGGDVSIPGRATMTQGQVDRREALVEEMNAALPRLKEFILPGGTRAAGLAHLARAVCRRAERALVALSSSEKVGDEGRIYLNRLSDFLFVLGRVLNREGGRGDVLWQQGRNR